MNKISVICATYNMADYLERCIDSVLNQTFRDFEFIVVNDGSTDGTATILEKYKDIITIVNQPNLGHSTARNVGMDNAHGEYFYFIDADDYIHPHTLEVLYDNLVNTDADISIGGYTRHGELPETLVGGFTVYSSIEALNVLIKSDMISTRKMAFIATWNKLFKRGLFDKVRFPDGHVHDDNATCHRLLGAAERIVYTTAVMYFYTRKEASISNNVYDMDMLLAYEDRIRYLESIGFNTDAVKRSYKEIARRAYMQTNDYSIVERAGLDVKQMIVYLKDATMFNGITVWIDNLCAAFKGRWHIRVLCSKGKRYEKYDAAMTYQCNVLLHNYMSDDVPKNINADMTYIILHCDYGAMLKEYHFDTTYKYLAVSNVAARGVRERYGLDCVSIEGLLMKRPCKNKVYKLISASRPYGLKGMDRIFKLADMFKEHGVCFQWLVFCNKDMPLGHVKSSMPEVIMSNTVPHDIFIQYVADADYVVQLSDEGEGFCCTVHEALLMGTPVIVTDIPVFSMVRNGYNGYKLPLDMANVDVDALLKVPKGFEYDGHYTTLRLKYDKLFRGRYSELDICKE